MRCAGRRARWDRLALHFLEDVSSWFRGINKAPLLAGRLFQPPPLAGLVSPVPSRPEAGTGLVDRARSGGTWLLDRVGRAGTDMVEQIGRSGTKLLDRVDPYGDRTAPIWTNVVVPARAVWRALFDHWPHAPLLDHGWDKGGEGGARASPAGAAAARRAGIPFRPAHFPPPAPPECTSFAFVEPPRPLWRAGLNPSSQTRAMEEGGSRHILKSPSEAGRQELRSSCMPERKHAKEEATGASFHCSNRFDRWKEAVRHSNQPSVSWALPYWNEAVRHCNQPSALWALRHSLPSLGQEALRGGFGHGPALASAAAGHHSGQPGEQGGGRAASDTSIRPPPMPGPPSVLPSTAGSSTCTTGSGTCWKPHPVLPAAAGHASVTSSPPTAAQSGLTTSGQRAAPVLPEEGGQENDSEWKEGRQEEDSDWTEDWDDDWLPPPARLEPDRAKGLAGGSWADDRSVPATHCQPSQPLIASPHGA